MARYNFDIKDGAELSEDREGSELAKAGERDPERSCEGVLQQWGRAAAHVAPSIAPGDQI